MYDVIVTGGGPAGSQAARLLAQEGFQVLMLEKGAPGRSKCCAGAVSGRALQFLRGIQLPACVDLHTVRLAYKGEELTYTSPDPIAKFVVRGKLDEILREAAEKAGAEIRYHTPAADIRPLGDKVEVETSAGKLQARYLIGADGATGVSRRLGANRPQRMAIGLEGEIFLPAAREKYQQTALIDPSGVPYGYCWLFPKADRLSVGIVSFSSKPAPLKKHFQRFLQTYGLPQPETLAHPLPALAPGKLVIGGCLLAGDAAALVDRFSGEGIAYALQSGTLAAETIGSALKAGGDIASYQPLVERQIYSQLKITSKLQKAFWFWPQLSHAVLKGRTSLLGQYFDTVAGKQSYEDLGKELKREFAPGRRLKRE